ncbi:MAG TPA: helix-turn-helix transcriptional regulator [Candidatus Sulfotelmatobacter sp.]|nr:helix-turn-helix transcriptional regulator [Candidatus Sulfotelmatobacter sp.]
MSIEFAQRVSAYMERGDLSQRSLARKIHIRRSTISMVLKGFSDLSQKDVLRFKDGLNIPIDDIVEFTLSSQGFTNSQVEKITGKKMRDLSEIRHAKRKLIDSRGRQFGLIRY